MVGKAVAFGLFNSLFLVASAAALPRGAVPPGGAPALLRVAASDADDSGFLFRLGLMQGHLMIGQELVRAGRPQLALPHFGHPVRELYDDIADYLAQQKVPGFGKLLIVLEAEAAKGDAPAVEARLAEVMRAIEVARAAAPAALRASVPATIRLCADTVEAAAGEYGEAIERGRIENLVEYHDSRGFLSYVAEQLARLDRQAADAAERDLVARFRAVLDRARAIVAPLMPPERPIKSVSDYRAVAAEAKAVAAP